MLRRALAAGAVAAALLLTACNGDDPDSQSPSGDPSPADKPPTVAADFCDKDLMAPVLALDEEPSVPNGSIDDKTAQDPPNYSAICNASLLAESGQVYLQIFWSPGNSADATRSAVQDRADKGATVSEVDGEGWEYAALATVENGTELSVDLLVHDKGVDYYTGASVRDSTLTAGELGDALVQLAHNAQAEVTG